MSNPDELAHISKYLRKNHVLSLCAQADGDMWCASCFYVTDPENMTLYLMTELKTRHGALMQQNPQVVGTISSQIKSVALIKGIQFSAQATILQGEDEQRARHLYCKRFPVAKVMKAPIWQLSLSDIKMTDNVLGFGKKIFWSRSQ